MFLSIIVPVYNVEDYIDDCINSILNQDNDNYELLLIENGSTDNSLEICKKYENNPKMRLFSLKESGVSKARNFGIAEAKGDYIWFVDGDDLIYESAIDVLEKRASDEGNPDVMIFTHTQLVNNKSANRKMFDIKGNIKKTVAVNGLFNHKLWNGFICNKVFKNNKEILANCRFDEDVHMAEDLVFFTRLFLRLETFSVKNDCLYYYRIRNGSISSAFDEKKLTSFKAYKLINAELKNYKEYEFARNIICNAQVNFSRQILTHYYFNDRKKYKEVCKEYENIIMQNFSKINGLKAKIGALLTVISPKISEKLR